MNKPTVVLSEEQRQLLKRAYSDYTMTMESHREGSKWKVTITSKGSPKIVTSAFSTETSWGTAEAYDKYERAVIDVKSHA